jgi:sugar/nucleoside kinase (ribokinase family)
VNTSTRTTTAATRAGILTGGNWIVDHVKIINRWPPQDALANITSQSSSNGGSAYNLVKDLAQFGAEYPLEAVGLVGDDESGRFIREDCARLGINLAQLRVTKSHPTSYTDVMTEASGRRTFFHCRGANADLGPEHFNLEASTARIFHVGYLMLLDRLDLEIADAAGHPATAASELFRSARSLGMRTSADLVSESGDRFPRVIRPSLPWLDYLFLNELEIAQVTGVPTTFDGRVDPRAIERAVEVMFAAGLTGWAFVHYPAAVLGCHAGGERIWQPALDIPAGFIRGAAGAGDALASGIIHGLHEGWEIDRCLRLGVCAAAASLARPTCSEGVGTIAECLALAKFSPYLPAP